MKEHVWWWFQFKNGKIVPDHLVPAHLNFPYGAWDRSLCAWVAYE